MFHVKHSCFLSRNFWINASAGSGKTTTLVNRILQLFLCQNDIPKICCLTFTNVAAKEMYDRVLDKIKKWNDCDMQTIVSDLKCIFPEEYDSFDDSFREKITLKAKDLFVLKAQDGLNVQTIHAFCNLILKEYAFILGMNSEFMVMDECRENILLQDAFSLWCDNIKADFFVEGYTKHKILEVCAKVISGCDVSDVNRFFQETNSTIRKLFHVEHIEQKYFYSNDDVVALQRECFDNEYKCYLNSASITNEFVSKHSIVQQWMRSEDKYALFMEYKDVFLTKEEYPRSRLVKKGNPEENAILNEQDSVARIYGSLKGIAAYCRNYNILLIVTDIVSLFQQEKERLGLLNYNDLIVKARHALVESNVRQYIKYNLLKKIEHLLIDEAQDNSLSQWEIIGSVIEEFFYNSGSDNKQRSFFVVGDTKQSIYGFQGANPDLFFLMLKNIQKKSQENEVLLNVVEQHVCYRCDESIIDLVNKMLSDSNIKRSLGCESKLIQQISKTEKRGLVQIYDLEQYRQKSNNNVLPWQEDESENDSVEILTEQIATTIKLWHETKRTITGIEKTISYDDIMILVRKRDYFLEQLVAAFNRNDVPYALDNHIYIKDSIITQDLLNIVRFCINPLDKISLCILLKSFFDYTEEQILLLSFNQFSFDFIDSSTNETIKKILSYSVGKNPYDFFCCVFFKLGFIEKIYNKFGATGHFVVNQWLEKLWELEDCYNICTLQQLFIFCVNNNIKLDQKHFSEGRVQISTIHGAKGKESSVVILPNTNVVLDGRNSDTFFLYNGVPIFGDIKAIQIDAIKKKIKDCQYSEDIRLLYVAITRAKNELHIYGISGFRDSEKTWYKILKEVSTESEQLVS